MIFKYQEKVLEFGIENCPPEGFEVDRMAYLWCHSPYDSKLDFIPPGIRKPRRLSKGEMKKRCDLLALSMYETENKAREYFIRCSFSEDNIKDIGEFISAGHVSSSDGSASDIDSYGHFNFHESSVANLSTQFSVLSKINIEW
jgi:hypothetical protein